MCRVRMSVEIPKAKRGRPRKKLDYDRAELINGLLEKASEKKRLHCQRTCGILYIFNLNHLVDNKSHGSGINWYYLRHYSDGGVEIVFKQTSKDSVREYNWNKYFKAIPNGCR